MTHTLFHAMSYVLPPSRTNSRSCVRVGACISERKHLAYNVVCNLHMTVVCISFKLFEQLANYDYMP
jgi:hypothetical protein